MAGKRRMGRRQGRERWGGKGGEAGSRGLEGMAGLTYLSHTADKTSLQQLL